jgi:hypothetical protein
MCEILIYTFAASINSPIIIYKILIEVPNNDFDKITVLYDLITLKYGRLYIYG